MDITALLLFYMGIHGVNVGILTQFVDHISVFHINGLFKKAVLPVPREPLYL